MNLSAQNQFSTKANQLLSWGHWFTFANIILAMLISLSYLIADDTPTTFIAQLYMVLNWVGHIGFLTFLCFVLTIFPLSLVFPYPRHIRGMAAIFATFGISLLTLDAYVYVNLGYHINASAFEQIISLIWQTLSSSPTMSALIIGVLFCTILFYELVVSNHTWKQLSKLQAMPCRKLISSVFVISFISSHVMHIWADANFNLAITKQDNTLPLSYPTTAKSLLAKNNLIDMNQYRQARTVNLIDKAAFVAPKITQNCPTSDIETALILVFKNHHLLQQYQTFSGLDYYHYDNFFQLATPNDTLFNLSYGLPPLYQTPIEIATQPPAWLNAIKANIHGVNSLVDHSSKEAALNIIVVSSNADFTRIPPANLQYAFALSTDKPSSNAIINSELVTTDARFKDVEHIVMPQDILTTVLTHSLKCPSLADSHTLGNDVFNSHADEGVTFSNGTLIAYKKDKITFIDAKGEFKSISAQQGFLLDEKLDVPFLVESVKRLKQFYRAN